MASYSGPLSLWLSGLKTTDKFKLLNKILADGCIFYSPVMHTPQKGKQLTFLYLAAAFKVLLQDGKFKYCRILEQGKEAILEFETEIDGIYIYGVDLITFNEQGQITEFKVMLRPLKAVEKIRELMFAELEAAKLA